MRSFDEELNGELELPVDKVLVIQSFYFCLPELEYMEAMCSWNETWEVGKNDMDCYREFCKSPNDTLLNTFTTEDWCPGGRPEKISNETHSQNVTHDLDAAERLSVERLCRWNSTKGVYTMDMVECYATHCDNPNTTVNQLYNYNIQWSAETDPMTPVTETIRYPCKDGSRLMDPSLWWKEDAEDYVDIYCGIDGEYQYPEPWLNCFPGKKLC